VTLDDDFVVTSVHEIDDRVARVEPKYPVHGIEDLRLFHRDGAWHVSSVTRERREDGLCEMHISRLDGPTIVDDTVIASPAGWRHEKNWMPIQDGDADFLYVLDPPTPMTIEGSTVRLRSDSIPSLPTFGPRGGSQVIKTYLGWLVVSHDVHIRDDDSRWYTQRFHLLDDSWNEIAVSPPWWFGEGAVEYVAGIAETPNGVVLSYGVNDSKARLAEVSWETVQKFLKNTPRSLGWFDNIARRHFETVLSGQGEKPLRALQIGAFTGDATCWLLNLGHGVTVDDVDTFAGTPGEDYTQSLDWDQVRQTYLNRTAQYGERCRVWEMTSDEFFQQYDGPQFDLIYIDGSHEYEQVLRDAVNAWPLLKERGLLAFDDYLWTRSADPDNIPRRAIDEFTAAHPTAEVVVRESQLWLKKVDAVRVAVAAPAKNEEANVQGWYSSASEADEIVLVDTGSTDDTLKIAYEVAMMDPHRMRVYKIDVNPWRFDVGRNAVLALVSSDIDIVVPLDLDERLEPGWREELEKAWRRGGKQFAFRFRYGPELEFYHDKIHARHGFQWKGAAHEYPAGPGPKVFTEVRITHHQDRSKSRTQYLDLLETGWREDPNPRNTYYLARELVYTNDWTRARELFQRYLAMPDSTYDQERSEACRFMARMVYSQFQESWLLRACYEAPQRRECWADLAVWYRDHGQPQVAAGIAARALSIAEQTPANSFHLESWAWQDAWLRGLALALQSAVDLDPVGAADLHRDADGVVVDDADHRVEDDQAAAL